jgi:hypothetical protein
MLFSAEHRLAVASACWPPSERHSNAVRHALGSAIDWERFQRLVERHRITALAHHALVNPHVAAFVPADVRTRLAGKALALARVSLQMQAETLRLHQAMADASLPVTFLKGVPLALLAYGNVALRQSKDIDVLVAQDLVGPTAALLESHGYERLAGPADFRGSQWEMWLREFHHCSFVHRTMNIEIELHWRLFRNPWLLPPAAHPAAAVVRLPDGRGLAALSVDDLFAYLCAHGALHNWFRLKWLADVGALLNQRSGEEAEHLFESAAARGAGLFAAQAMLLAHGLLGAPLPQSLIGRVRAVGAVSRLEKRSMSVLLGAAYEAEPGAWPLGARLRYERDGLRLGGTRYKATQVRQLLTSQDDVEALRLPRRAAFMYPVIRAPRWVWRRIRQMSPPARTPRSLPRR